MGERFKRQTNGAIESSEDGSAGVISGIVATGGEADDGHRLNIAGVQIGSDTPMLWNHKRNLGKWNDFTKLDTQNPSEAKIRGVGNILLGGDGEERAWRNDVNYMIGEGAVTGLSMFWDIVDQPIKRTSLPKDHWARVDRKTATGRQEFGLYFETSEMSENSVVTLGSDKAALIGRMLESEGFLRSFWRSSINEAMEETYPAPGNLVGVDVDGEIIYVERAAYDAMLEEANSRLQLALDLHEQRVDDQTFEWNSEEIDDLILKLCEQSSQRLRDAMNQPEPDQEPDTTRADHPEDGEADPLPQEEAITMKGLIAVIEESRKLQAADTALMIERKFGDARGRVT